MSKVFLPIVKKRTILTLSTISIYTQRWHIPWYNTFLFHSFFCELVGSFLSSFVIAFSRVPSISGLFLSTEPVYKTLSCLVLNFILRWKLEVLDTLGCYLVPSLLRLMSLTCALYHLYNWWTAHLSSVDLQTLLIIARPSVIATSPSGIVSLSRCRLVISCVIIYCLVNRPFILPRSRTTSVVSNFILSQIKWKI